MFMGVMRAAEYKAEILGLCCRCFGSTGKGTFGYMLIVLILATYPILLSTIWWGGSYGA